MYMGMGDAGTSSAMPTSTAPQVWFTIGGSADQWGDLTATDQANWLASAGLAYAAGALPSLPAGASGVADAQAATTPLGIPLWGWAAAAGAVVLLFLTKGK